MKTLKKALYVFLLLVEFLLGAYILAMITFYTGQLYLLLSVVIWAVLTIMLLAKMRKAENDARKRKLKVWLALVMLIPLVVGVAALAAFIIAMAPHI